MAMMRRTLLLILFVGCATAQQQPHGEQAIDAPTHSFFDAPKQFADASAIPDAATIADAAPITCSSSGVLATYSFSGAPGNQAQQPAASTATGVIATPIVRSPTLVADAASSSISASNWSLNTQLDATKYYTFSLVPATGCILSLTSLTIDTHASPNGPEMSALATSADNYATKIAIATSGVSTPALAVMNATGAVQIRVYGYAASTTGGSYRLETTLTVSGSVK
jgi:hypothetical protein